MTPRKWNAYSQKIQLKIWGAKASACIYQKKSSHFVCHFEKQIFIFWNLFPISKMPMNSSQWIDVTTEKNHYSLDHFVVPTHYEKDVSSILIPHGVIMDRVNKLARLIVDEATGPLVVCCILKGGHQYFADLVNAVKKLTTKDGQTVPLSLEFIRVKSYKNDKSEGVTMSITDEECNEFKGKVC